MSIVYFYKAAQYFCATCGSFMRGDFLPSAPSAVTPRVIVMISECKNPTCEQFGLQIPMPLGEYDSDRNTTTDEL